MQHVWYTTDVLVPPVHPTGVSFGVPFDMLFDVAFASSGSVVLVLAISIPPPCLLLKWGQCNPFQNIFCN